MVVKYARSEKEVITAQNQREAAEKKTKELAKERDVLMEKVKGLNAEKTRVCHMLEAKVSLSLMFNYWYTFLITVYLI